MFAVIKMELSGKTVYGTCRRFDTVPACDGQTDGQTDRIAVANTALAVRALRAP